MQDTPVAHARPDPMPPAIAKAILEAIEKVQSAIARTKGEDEATARQYKYASINDVLDAAHDILKDVGLHALPIEVEYQEEWVDFGGIKQLWARYGYQFRLIQKTAGVSWIEERDVRHVSLQISGTGQNAGKAQSLALRDYLKGLLRIKTAEPDLEDGSNAKNVSRETSSPAAAKKDAIPFDFGKQGKGGQPILEPLTPQEARARFEAEVAPLDAGKRQQWEEANEVGMRALYEVANPTWLALRKMLEGAPATQTREKASTKAK